jgi:hypothetical protein
MIAEDTRLIVVSSCHVDSAKMAKRINGLLAQLISRMKKLD